MSDEARLLQIIENCIKQVGHEWNEKEDVGFFGEADLRAKLLSMLWAEPNLMTSVLLEPVRRVSDIPLAHAERLGAKGRRISAQGAFDIVIFEAESIKTFAKETRWSPTWQEEERKLEVLAVIEIKDQGQAWNAATKKDLDKLLERVGVDPIKHGYLIIFYDAQKEPVWTKVVSEINQLRVNKDVKIYFAPCGGRSTQARWI